NDPQAVVGLELLVYVESVKREAARLLEPVYRARGDQKKRAEVLEMRVDAAGPAEQRALLRGLAALREPAGGPQGALSSQLRLFRTDPEDAHVRAELDRLAQVGGLREELLRAYLDVMAHARQSGKNEGLFTELWRGIAALQEAVGQTSEAAAAWEEVSIREP